MYYCPATGQRTPTRPFWHQIPSDLTHSQEVLAKYLSTCLEDKYRREPVVWSTRGATPLATFRGTPETYRNFCRGPDAMYLDDALSRVASIDYQIQRQITYAEAVAATRSALPHERPRFIVGQHTDMRFPGGVRYYISASTHLLIEWISETSLRHRDIERSSSSHVGDFRPVGLGWEE